jgi:pimeloyl-ACP methyl ester carboxylesterase
MRAVIAVRRGIAMWALFVLGGALGVALLGIDNWMWDEGGPGIIGFELAWDSEQSQRILAEWGDSGRDAARLSLWLDFLYLAAYAAFWTLAARAARDAAVRHGWRRLSAAGARLWPLPIVAGAFDVLENVALLVQLGGADGRGWPVVAASAATVKFLAIGVAIAYVAYVVVRSLCLRSPRAFRRVVVALVAVGVVALALNTWIVERATEPAKADIGQILDLPGGDIQVREDGPRDAPPVVLIHGYSASMRWWDQVTPALARRLHVIRIDLLGHGGSEKPRDGYSMEDQADIVAQAMERVGVARAPIVGHSMGGIVATAFAERHRDMVSRLMMIGTSPDAVDLEGGLLAEAASWPVVGHANDTLVSDRIVRYVVEQGFAPAFDPPAELTHDIFGRTTFTAFRESAKELSDYWDERRLDERLAPTGVPVTVILGERERHTRRSVGLYNAVPKTRTVVMQGLDHTPQVESPERTAPLIEAFALEP